ncbi:MAG: DUF3299 domain-containing protein [Pseudomonadota bacterium]
MTPLTRRRALALALATAALARPGQARDVIDLDWGDLIPEGETAILMEQLRGIGVVQHGQLSTGFTQERDAELTTEFNGARVRLPGFVVPLDFSASGTSAFVLAPFVGACIHVPPPPPNQLVFVTTERPYRSKGLFEPVYVTGLFDTVATGTEVAEVGYAISADRVERYR